MSFISALENDLAKIGHGVKRVGEDAAHAAATEKLSVHPLAELEQRVEKALSKVKSYEDNVDDLTATSANFKTLRDNQSNLANKLQEQIQKLTAQRDNAITIANEADATATAIDSILGSIAGAKQKLAPVNPAPVTPLPAPSAS